MHVLFVHKNFPAQFGHIAAHLTAHEGWRCTFVSEKPPLEAGGVANVQYTVRGGSTEATHVCARTFENAIWHAAGVFDALKPVSAALKPDLIVGHSGFGSTCFLHELFGDVPVINYFEWYYRAQGGDLEFRHDLPSYEIDRLRAPARNAMILLDLEMCSAGYAPTAWQHSRLPEAYRPKVKVLHDGIDTGFWHRRELPDRTLGSLKLEPGEKLVTYVSRGLESMRGFDRFMAAAARITAARDDVRIVVVGKDETAYGGDNRFTGDKTFRDWVLARGDFDLSRIHFAGHVDPQVLVRLLSLSDCHVYLTVPFVLSWSLLDAMACGCTVVGSDTPPVREVITDGENGLLADFFDDAAIAERVLAVLDDPAGHRATLGEAARQTIAERYSMEKVMPEMTRFYAEVAGQ